MNSIRIDTGIIRLTIDDDPERVIAFNPEDVGFADAFYKLYADLSRKQAELEKRWKELEANGKPDDVGIQDNVSDYISLARDVIQYVRDGIDSVFGVGTSDKAFGDVYSLVSLESFFEGITPYIQKARAKKLDAHIAKRKSKVLK